MFSGVADNSSETNRLLQASDHDATLSWDTLLRRHRDRLRRMVSLRIDPRARGWIDPSEVVLQAFAEAASRRSEYLTRPPGSFFLWLRELAGERLRALHEQRLGVALAPDGRELSLRRKSLPAATSFALAHQLLGQQSAGGEETLRARRVLQLESALNGMDTVEREVLALRHFEQLTGAETAALLHLDEGEAGRTYLRALKRLREILNSLPPVETRS